MQASIVKGNEVILDGLRVSVIKETGLSTWVGYAYLPPNSELDEGEYGLRLEDGRTGAFLVVSVREGIARLRGLGPLA